MILKIKNKNALFVIFNAFLFILIQQSRGNLLHTILVIKKLMCFNIIYYKRLPSKTYPFHTRTLIEEFLFWNQPLYLIIKKKTHFHIQREIYSCGCITVRCIFPFESNKIKQMRQSFFSPRSKISSTDFSNKRENFRFKLLRSAA